MFKFILNSVLGIIFLMPTTNTEAAVSKETGKLLSASNQALRECLQEAESTGQSSGKKCQNFNQARAEYEAAMLEECKIPNNASYKICTMTDDEKHAKQQEKINAAVKAYAQAQQTRPSSSIETVSAPAATKTAEKSNDVEVLGMVTTSTANESTGSSKPLSTSVSSSSSSGALFSDLTNKGVEIFGGMREIIYAVAGFGIMAVAIGGFFGVINWRWLASIIIGLMVIASASSLINYMVDSEVISDSMITDSLINAS